MSETAAPAAPATPPTQPENVVTRSQTESVTVSRVLGGIPAQGIGLASDIIQKASPFSKGVALVLVALIASIGALIYFNKEYFADVRDYKVAIARLEAKLEGTTDRFNAQSDIMDLLKQKIVDQQIEIKDNQVQLISLQAEVTRLKATHPM